MTGKDRRPIVIPQFESSLFDFSLWRAGSPVDLFGIRLRSRTADICSPLGSSILCQYAIGYCLAERIPCRPKSNEVAVMFYKDREYFWFHLRRHEFDRVFHETR